MDEHKDKIRGVLKGRVPADKDLKQEIAKVQRLGLKIFILTLFQYSTFWTVLPSLWILVKILTYQR